MSNALKIKAILFDVLRQYLPSLSDNSLIGSSQRESILLGKLGVRCSASSIFGSHRHDDFRCHLSRRILRSYEDSRIASRPMFISALKPLWMKARRVLVSSRRSSFANHVRAIVSLATKKQMVRVNARRIVALVEHAQFSRIDTIMQAPHYAAGKNAIASRKSNLPMSLCRLGPGPIPASIAFRYSLPKALFLFVREFVYGKMFLRHLISFQGQVSGRCALSRAAAISISVA